MTERIVPRGGATQEFNPGTTPGPSPALPVPDLPLEAATKALEDAQGAHVDARRALDTATAEAARLRGEVKAGRGAKIKPEDLLAADSAVDHATLLLEGTEARLRPLAAAVKRAQADSVCDSIVAGLSGLGTELELALDVLASELPALQLAASSYDASAAEAANRIQRHALDTPRVKSGRHDAPSVDKIRLQPSRAWAHLAALLAPVMSDLGAPAYAVDQLKTLAASAPTLPA